MLLLDLTSDARSDARSLATASFSLARDSALATLILALTMSSPSLAFRPLDAGEDLSIELPALQTAYLYETGHMLAEPAAAAASADLRAELGPGWVLRAWNQYTQTPRLAYGPGILVQNGGLARASEVEVETLSRRLIAAHPHIFGTDGHNLERFKIVHAAGKWSVIFRQVESGLPVMSSSVMLTYTDDGRLFAIGANVYEVDIPLRPTIEPQVAAAIARSAVPYDPRAELAGEEDALVLLPLHRGTALVDLRLAHRTDVPTRHPLGLWRTFIDGHSGEIIHRMNRIQHAYHGTAEGDAEITSYCFGDSVDNAWGRMYVDITDVGVATTEVNGDFSIAGNSGPHLYTAEFNGPDFDVDCIDCGGDAIWNGVIEPDMHEPIYFDAGAYRPDERDAYYYTTQTKFFIESIDDTYAMDKYTVEVNYDDRCNAFHIWNERTLRFFREAGGCANSARLGDVVAHELGHGVQAVLMGDGNQGQQGLGEGNSDITGTYMTDDPMVARGWTVGECDSGIGRTCDNDLTYPDHVIGQEIHYAGQVICGFHWDCRLSLEASMGPAQGKAYSAHLWHFSRKLYGNPDMTQPDQVWAYFLVDDDDANLSNGTPNYYLICDAAEQHGFPCTPDPYRIEIDHTPLTDRPDPAGPYSVQADIVAFLNGTPTSPDETEVFYALNGGSFTALPMSHLGGGTYEGLIPTQPAGTALSYYIRAAHTGGGLEAFHPAGAPADFYTIAIGSFTAVADHRMEIDEGWTVGAPGDNATDGVWERGDPEAVTMGPILLQPEDDHTPDPGVNCWVTGVARQATPFQGELDGRSSLNTPVFDLSEANIVQGHFWFFTHLLTEAGDSLDFRISTDGWVSWTSLFSNDTPTTPNWSEFTFRLHPHDFNFTDQVQFRFVGQDTIPDGVVEMLVDDFYLEGLIGGTTGIAAPEGVAPLRLSLGPARPNPFNPQTEIRYSLPSRADVRLAIYDVEGRLVRNLIQRSQDRGEYAVRWDGRDRHGNIASSGVYFYRLEVGDWSEARPVVLVK